MIRVVGIGWVMRKMFHCPVSQALHVLANSRVAAAVACVRKYLVVASTARGWWFWAIIGRMAIVLISRPIHARSQWELAKVIVVPRPRASSRTVITRGLISKGRILTNMSGVWAQKLVLADFTRRWCIGSTKSFDLFGRGSSPLLLRAGGISTLIFHSIKVVL